MNFPVKGTPKTHQLHALSDAARKRGHCYWLDPGAGKTFVCIAEAGQFWQDDLIDGVLVVAPNGPHRQWVEEQFPLWAEFLWSGVHNKQSKRKQEQFFSFPRQGLAVAAINYHALNFKSGKEFVAKFTEMYPRFMLVIDESQKIKDPKSGWSKQVNNIADGASYVRALSGTPLLNTLEDLFWQYHTVHPGMTGTRSMTAFRREYCILQPIPGARSRWAMRTVGYKNEERLQELTAPYVTRIKAEDFMVSPEPTMSKIWVPMENKEWLRAYEQMKKDLMVTLAGEEVTVQNALGQLQKLQQLACGFVYDEEGRAHWYDHGRVEAVTELVQELNEPVIIWSPYKALTEALRAAVDEMEFREWYQKGETDDWKQDLTGILIGHQGSGLGVGMNLQHAAAAIYAANTFSAEERWQSMKRIDRIGQDRQVRFWDVMVPGTVDARVIEALDNKQELSRANVDTLRRMIS